MSLDCKAVELDKVLQLLAEEAACEDAREMALSLMPAATPEEAETLLRETDDAYVLMAKFGAPSFRGLINITNALRRAEAGGVLNLAELLRVAGVLQCIRLTSDWYKRNAGVKTSLDGRFFYLMPNKYLEDRINAVVISEDEVADAASPLLADIRRKIRAASAKTREQLDKMIRSVSHQKYLQDAIVTQRGGRFVVPVKAEFRGEIPGLVHDTSGSGATVFIEPMSVVELNNEIRMLESREKAEIERILLELSGEVGGFADAVIEGYKAAAELSLIFAKASLGYKMKAVMPKLNREGRIDLKRARHPLIDPKTVVPTDMDLGIRFSTLIITGPNTGGKTVALKTLGLLTLMAMCGLMVPAGEESELSFFRHVFANIGDEQSIEQSLSTFSSHMKGIIHMLREADEESLVLLDELGSGTDPVEGAALAMAILEELQEKGAKVAATTHYAELKEYALQTENVENGCCEFDVATLKPTYKLLIGVPGRSNAFAISERLGMEQKVVDRAKALVSAEDTRFADVVEKLEKTRAELEKERTAAESDKAEALRLKEEAEKRMQEAETSYQKELERAREEASRIVSRTRAQSDALLNELEEMKKQRNKAISQEQKARLKAGLRDLEKSADPVSKKKTEPYVLPRALKPGDPVLIFDIDKNATVLELSKDGKSALVQAGIIKTRVELSNLRLLQEEPKQQKARRGITKNIETSRPATEVDMRGMTVEEALMLADQAIDSAILSGVHQITFIHGKGTGALRSAVQQHLKRHPSIKTFRLGVYGEGESGVTIAELK